MHGIQRFYFLIVDCDGIGAYITKSVILVGVKSVSVTDPTPPSLADLSSNSCLKDTNASSSRPHVAALVHHPTTLISYYKVYDHEYYIHLQDPKPYVLDPFAIVVKVNQAYKSCSAVNALSYECFISVIMWSLWFAIL